MREIKHIYNAYGKYAPGDIVWYMGADAPIKCKIISFNPVFYSTTIDYRYCVKVFPLRENWCDTCFEHDLYKTKEECEEGYE